MTYAPRPPTAVNFNLAEEPYIPPAGPAVSFDLATGDSGPPPIVYPIPPGIMVTSALSIELTSSAPVSSAGVDYSMKPAQRTVRRALRSAMASRQLDGRAPQQWGKVAVKDESIDDGVQPWGTAGRKDPRQVGSGWDRVPIKDDDRGGPDQAWDGSIKPIDQRAGQGYNVPALKDVADRHPQADSARYWEWPQVESFDGYVVGSSDFDLTASPYNIPGAAVVDFNLEPSTNFVEIIIPTRPLFSGRDLQGWTTNKPADVRYRQPWDDKPRKGTEVDFDYDQQPPLPGDPPDEPKIKRAYIIMNSSSLIATAENMPLEFSGLTIELDVDSFAWKMSCSILNRQSLDLIRPTAQGPAEVVATVNGHQWRFIVERYSLDKRFARERWRVTGVSRPQLLANPYAPRRTGRIEQPTNMALAMANQLEFTGFTVMLQDGLYDYVIPAGAWGYENKTAMEVVSELAAAVGAVVIPDRTDDILHINHRYKQTPPWYYPGVAESDLDAVIQDSMVIGYSSQWEPQPEYNYVFVSGITDGVSTEVIRQGSAGDQPAPDIYDELNVEVQQCRLRGITALSAGGNQEIVTVETILPTSGSPGLIVPAMLVEYRDARDLSATWRGNVLGVSINVSKPGASRVIQSVKVERHHY
ncbi:MAG TPA: hypothetical protein VFN01_00400 [Marinobacter sp.]|uniref:hypothetical protein n=1 Tax=Marinobacter sp. TaxID=50741 RepID=UPI002D80464B|nr:hypothetical protein [Marinobacter sp.]HET8799617.1 hypothetical protein [Marinobacter sp.]